MDLEKILQEFPIYNKLSPSELEHFISFLQVVKYKKDETISSSTKAFEYIAVILSGSVEYYIFDPLEERAIKVGSFKRYPIGAHNLVTEKSPGVTIKAKEDTVLLAINIKDMQKIEEFFPHLGMHFYKGLVKAQFQITNRVLQILIKHHGRKISNKLLNSD
jgi:signal-transduction protein with cAMP-binding, CBS, and nucleotidyltransferase domain